MSRAFPWKALRSVRFLFILDGVSSIVPNKDWDTRVAFSREQHLVPSGQRFQFSVRKLGKSRREFDILCTRPEDDAATACD